MMSALVRHLSRAARAFSISTTISNLSLPFSSLAREVPEVSYGLNWALAGRGIIVKHKAYYNLKPSELKNHGAATVEQLSGVPLHVRGNVVGGAPDISKAQFSKLLIQVSTHLSSLDRVYVQDGAVGSSPKCNAKVRVISDNPSAMSAFSNFLYEIPTTRSISHDSCPLTVYIASSISPIVKEFVGPTTHQRYNNGFGAADIERSSLILCGKAFADFGAIKDALSALASPILSARGGIPLSARILVSGDSLTVLFAPEEIIKESTDIQKSLIATNTGVILSFDGFAPFFKGKDSTLPSLLKKPSAFIFASSDSTGAHPSASKLSPGQAAYHFLAGFQDGKFVPAFNKGPSSINPLSLANSLFSELKESNTPSFLVNVNEGGKLISGKDLIKRVELVLSNKLLENKSTSDAKVGDLKGKYKCFLIGKFQSLPEEFTF